MGFPDGSVVNNPPANAGVVGSIPKSGRSPLEDNGNPLQYSCLGNPMDRGIWWATIHNLVCSKRIGHDLATKLKQTMPLYIYIYIYIFCIFTKFCLRELY